MKKVNLKTGIFFIAVILFTACARKQYIVKNIEVSRVEMNSTWEPATNTGMRILVNSLKTTMTEETQKVIGTANRTLTKSKPQSLLTNFTADAMLYYASGLWGTVDFAVMNIGGIRNTLNQGEITIGDMYEIFPFNNRLVLLELPGKAVEEFFDSVAKSGGEGLSKNMEVIIEDKAVNSLKIGGKAVDENKIYRVAAIDYLAEGNDGMEALTKAVKVTDSNKLLRDVLIEYVKKQTAENKVIDSNLDNRITIRK
ncbi:5'-nucleotidase [Bacteroidia bacterium]|nr:5'-nucleotidase [Bacteroidia bacterium]GHV31316.1 5'-nucleotidase [Bacteroidia bacterium]